jgi:ketosteroid isomerase-like protein
MSAIETVLDFLDRINKRDADKLAELMSEDHVFIGSLGNTMQCREKMRRVGAAIIQLVFRQLARFLDLSRYARQLQRATQNSVSLA